jgi:hypothetical protein
MTKEEFDKFAESKEWLKIGGSGEGNTTFGHYITSAGNLLTVRFEKNEGTDALVFVGVATAVRFNWE